MSNLYKDLWARLKNFSASTLVTADDDGTLRHSRVCLPRTDRQGGLWFFVPAQRVCLRNVRLRQHVTINLTTDNRTQSASVSGVATIVTDLHTRRARWTALRWERMAHVSPEVSEIADWREAVLISVAVDYAEYWEHSRSDIGHFAGSVEALGSEYEEECNTGRFPPPPARRRTPDWPYAAYEYKPTSDAISDTEVRFTQLMEQFMPWPAPLTGPMSQRAPL